MRIKTAREIGDAVINEEYFRVNVLQDAAEVLRMARDRGDRSRIKAIEEELVIAYDVANETSNDQAASMILRH